VNPAVAITAFEADKWLPATSENFPGTDAPEGHWGFEGRSASWMLENILTHPYSTATLIEPGTSVGLDILKFNLLGRYPQSIEIVEDFSSCLNTFNDCKYDIIYIDGAHSEEIVYEDGKNAMRLIKMGGIIGFDDYEWVRDKLSPKKAIDRILREYESGINILHKDWQVWISKK